MVHSCGGLSLTQDRSQSHMQIYMIYGVTTNMIGGVTTKIIWRTKNSFHVNTEELKGNPGHNTSSNIVCVQL